MDQIADPTPFIEVALGLTMLVVVIFIHGVGLRTINSQHSRAWAKVGPQTSRIKVDLMLAKVIASFAMLHLLETLLFALPLSWTRILPDLRDSYYFVLESYTTLGEGNVQLPTEWRLLGPMIAMAGLFTFGWTGSSLVSVMTQFSQLDKARARQADAATTDKAK